MRNFNLIFPGYLTKETAYPFDCEPDDKSNRWL